MASLAALHPRVEPRSFVMATLFAGALAIGWALLPGQAERIAMLERDGRGREALALLERNFGGGDRSARTLFQMHHHYEQFGDLDNARRTLEMLTEQRPRDAQALRRLALFYKHTQDVDAQIGALRRLISVRYSEEACKELIGLYRQRGQFAEEQGALQDCRQKGYRRADDLIRLASLLAVDGELTQAVGLLRSADDLRRIKSEAERLRLFGILLILDQPREALRRAIRWVRGQRNEAFVDLLVDQLVLANRVDAALALVREVGTPGDAIALTAGELMLNMGQQAAARTYLRGWLENARMTTATQVTRFIRTALDAGDPEIALSGARRYGLDLVPQTEIALLAGALMAADKLAEVEVIRPYLQPDMLRPLAQPRAGTRRAGGPGRSGSSAVAPSLSEPARELEGWRLGLWTRLMTAPMPGAPVAAAADPAASLAQTKPGLTPGRARVTAKILRKITKARSTRAKTGQTAGTCCDAWVPAGGGTQLGKQ